MTGSLPAPKPRSAQSPPPLSGIRVADFSHFVAGPYATMMLGDMGADIIKIESPEKGDEYRYYGLRDPRLQGEGTSFLWSNRNKRSIALDLKSVPGRKAALEIVRQSDVLVENFSTGVLERLGLGYAECIRINPRLIYCSVSAYGRDGALAARRGFDAVVQAESGFISMNGYPDSEGFQTDATVMDIATAVMACNAIFAALIARTQTGHGQKIGVSLYDTAMTMVGPAAMRYLVDRTEPERRGNDEPHSPLDGQYDCGDASFYLSCGNDFGTFQRLLADVVGRTDLATDARYRDLGERVRQRNILVPVLAESFRTRTWADLSEELRSVGAAAGEIRTVAQALRSDESRDCGAVTEIPHPSIALIPNITPPYQFSKTPLADPVAAPLLGQHSAAIIAELGLDLPTAPRQPPAAAPHRMAALKAR